MSGYKFSEAIQEKVRQRANYLCELGRATIDVLNMNRERVLNIRSSDIAVGRHPPKDDPILS